MRFPSVALSLAAVLATLGLAPGAHAAGSPTLPVPYGLTAGLVAEALSPGASPPGANDFGCRPGAAHPRPVVLLHGFGANMTDSWQTVSPLLRNNGYCVFALTYGTYPKVDPTGQIGGLDYIGNSSKQVAAFVDKVLASSGADKVDLVGWSEGGWLGRQYIGFDGGAQKVANYVGLAPANGPTNVSQAIFAIARLSPVAEESRRILFSGVVESVVPLVGQAADPHLFAQLNVGGGTSPLVVYTNIATRYDELVPPSSAFVPTGKYVTNIVLQDGCPIDFTDHLSIVSAPRAMGFLLNALDPAHAKKPPCVVSLPVLG